MVPEHIRAAQQAASARSELKTRWVLAAEVHQIGLIERQFIAQRFGALRFAKAATEEDDAFGDHSWRGKQLTSIGKLVTTDKLPIRCVPRWTWLIFNY